jgi:hypothetical protein
MTHQVTLLKQKKKTVFFPPSVAAVFPPPTHSGKHHLSTYGLIRIVWRSASELQRAGTVSSLQGISYQNLLGKKKHCSQ